MYLQYLHQSQNAGKH